MISYKIQIQRIIKYLQFYLIINVSLVRLSNNFDHNDAIYIFNINPEYVIIYHNYIKSKTSYIACFNNHFSHRSNFF